jgi:hypothetical protein
MEQTILALLTARNIEDAAKIVGVSPKTLLRWQQDPEFAAAFRKAHRAAYGQAPARLRQASSAAVSAGHLAKALALRRADAHSQCRSK